jgi:hypothetical protein
MFIMSDNTHMAVASLLGTAFGIVLILVLHQHGVI